MPKVSIVSKWHENVIIAPKNMFIMKTFYFTYHYDKSLYTLSIFAYLSFTMSNQSTYSSNFQVYKCSKNIFHHIIHLSPLATPKTTATFLSKY